MRDFLTLDDVVEGPDHAQLIAAGGLRFTLAEDRIRDFLMGENLYGDPSLAIREAYQNALDAVRLRAARLERLRLPALEASPEAPEIQFEQGIDARGRAYIDCVDRGAGMGVDELTLAFCQAGVRASDLDGRIAEIAAFAAVDPPVRLVQNSRFGIGVMSYFMIADELTVRTARLNPDGSIGNVLSMHVAGPDATFDAHDLGAADSPGTRVRLWLKPNVSLSAVSTLRDLVIVCPVHFRAVDRSGVEHRWAPDELNVGSSQLDLLTPRAVSAAIPGTLWWVEDRVLGAILADGIWAGVWLSGFIVNLRGKDAPALTADRRKIVAIDWEVIESLARSAGESAVNDSWHIVGSPAWLSEMTRRLPAVADAIVARASARGDRTLTIHGRHVSVTEAGYLPGDEDRALNGASNAIANWRLARLRAAGLYDKCSLGRPAPRSVTPARPSDAILLGSLERVYRSGVEEQLDTWFPSTASIYEAERHLRYSVPHIVCRARELGLPVRDDAELLPRANDVVRTALSQSRRHHDDGTLRAISAFDVMQTAWQLDVTVNEVVAELTERHIELDGFAATLSATPLLPSQLLAVSRHGNGIAPWLDSSEEVTLGHIVRAARAGGQTCDDTVADLRRLGFNKLPVLRLTGVEPTDDDVVMVSWDLDGESPYLRADTVTNLAHLTAAAQRLERREEDLRRRFLEFGITFSASGTSCTPESDSKKDALRRLGLSRTQRRLVRPRHLRSMSENGDGQSPWIDSQRLIPAWLVATRALGKHSIDTIIDDYRWLGFSVEDPRTVATSRRPGTEHI